MQIFFRRAQHSRARVSGAHRMSLLELPSTAQKHRASDFCLRSVSGNQNVRGRSRQYTRTPRRFVDSESEGARETKSRKKLRILSARIMSKCDTHRWRVQNHKTSRRSSNGVSLEARFNMLQFALLAARWGQRLHCVCHRRFLESQTS